MFMLEGSCLWEMVRTLYLAEAVGAYQPLPAFRLSFEVIRMNCERSLKENLPGVRCSNKMVSMALAI